MIADGGGGVSLIEWHTSFQSACLQKGHFLNAHKVVHKDVNPGSFSNSKN